MEWYDHRPMAAEGMAAHPVRMVEFVILLGLALGFTGVVGAALLAIGEATRDEAQNRIER
jgi:hypothetical protein